MGKEGSKEGRIINHVEVDNLSSLGNIHYRVAAEKRIDGIFFAGNQTVYQKIAIHRDIRRLALESTSLSRYINKSLIRT